MTDTKRALLSAIVRVLPQVQDKHDYTRKLNEQDARLDAARDAGEPCTHFDSLGVTHTYMAVKVGTSMVVLHDSYLVTYTVDADSYEMPSELHACGCQSRDYRLVLRLDQCEEMQTRITRGLPLYDGFYKGCESPATVHGNVVAWSALSERVQNALLLQIEASMDGASDSMPNDFHLLFGVDA